MAPLTPVRAPVDIVGEPLTVHHMVKSNGEYAQSTAELFRMVGLDPSMAGPCAP